jgi:5,10-methylenetetrahydromethanopterin reductase
MRIGVVVPNQGATVARVADALARTDRLGFDSAWMPGIPNGPDVLTLLAAAGSAGPRLELGPSVLPTYPRHPATLAIQALTVNDVLGGRLTLGIGVSHRQVMEGRLGLDWSRPASHMQEYLQILEPLLREQQVDFEGSQLTTSYRLEASHSELPRPEVFVAALAPRMLAIAGTLAAGAATWMVGLRTLEELTVPIVRQAAARAGRPPPRILASLPFLLTSDDDAAEVCATEEFAVYGRLPVYRAVLERQGLTSPAEIAVFGDEKVLADAVRRLEEVGVTDLQITPFGAEADRHRTLEFMATLR